MIFRVRIRARARDDIRAARDWYEPQSVGLGRECTDLMFDTENTFSPRRAMPDISPLATDFSALDILSIQLWE